LQGELADDENTSADVRYRSVHPPGIVREDSQPCDLAHEHVDIGHAITHGNTDK
jgi:hypothetical protein